MRNLRLEPWATLTFPRDVLSLLNHTRSIFSSYLRIRASATSANSPELIDARNELEENIRDLGEDLKDLVESVKAVESDPYRFGIELDEVERRRKLVHDVGSEVESMQDEMKKTIHDAQGKGKGVANGDMLPDPDTFDDEDTYAAFEQERQMEIMHEQDEALDGVFRTVGNLRQQADDMGRELEEQTEMLKEVDTIADRVGGTLHTGMKKVGWVIKQNEGTPPFLPNHSSWQLTGEQINGPAAASLF
jgi:member of the syntaxin family of t-SNAREs